MRDLITNLSSVELTIPEKVRVKVLDYVFDHVLDVTMDVRVAVVDALEISVKRKNSNSLPSWSMFAESSILSRRRSQTAFERVALTRFFVRYPTPF